MLWMGCRDLGRGWRVGNRVALRLGIGCEDYSLHRGGTIQAHRRSSGETGQLLVKIQLALRDWQVSACCNLPRIIGELRLGAM